jgi:hypothetical protein
MITGTHVLFYSKDPEADRRFFRDILKFDSVDVGEGWLIFALPPAEAAVHPAGESFVQSHGGHDMMGAIIYFICDDVAASVRSLKARKVRCSPITRESWGMKTTLRLPSGGEIGLYQPTHPSPLDRSQP